MTVKRLVWGWLDAQPRGALYELRAEGLISLAVVSTGGRPGIQNKAVNNEEG